MDIAIIGMAGRFPEAANIEEFYLNLLKGRDSVRELPLTRRLNTNLPIDKKYRPAGYLDTIDQFDYGFFGISLGEAQHMDPRQRLLLEVVYAAIENAGYDPRELDGSDTAVYAVANEPDYYKHASVFDPTLITGHLPAATAGRLARFFNFRNKALLIDSACSSSLLAVHQAVCDLSAGECSAAIVAGISIDVFPLEFDQKTDTGILAPDGKAKAFAAGANGTAQGEATACILLKPLQQAIADGNLIHAVIKGTAANQDAALSGSLTAPSSRAQSEVLQAAWKKAGIHPTTLTYLEAHGTGTKLGDPTEIEGINSAFAAFTDKKNFCAISSLKSNIGHTDRMAGLSSLIKVVLSLRHRVLFPSLHFDKPNPFIDFANAAVFVTEKPTPWEVTENLPRRAGLSSFSLMGTNVHAILEEYTTPAPAPGTTTYPPLFFLLSARTAFSLRANLNALLQWLQTNPAPDLKDLSYTLAAGRQHFPLRFAVVADNPVSLIAALQQQAPFPENSTMEKLVLVFSHHTSLPEEWISLLRDQHPLFRLHFDRCFTALENSTGTTVKNIFSFQVAMYHLLVSWGISSLTLLGDGIGKISIDHITDKKPWDSIADNLNRYIHATDEELPRKVKRLLSEIEGDGVLFMELGPLGSITEIITDSREKKKNIEVIALPALPDPESIAAFAARLFIHGLPVDWRKAPVFKGAARLEIPSYHFNPDRVWLGQPLSGNLSRWGYVNTWQLQPADKFTISGGPGKWRHTHILLITGKEEAGDWLIRHLQDEGAVITLVREAAVYRHISPSVFEMPLQTEDSYRQLRTDLMAAKLTGIINAVSIGEDDEEEGTGGSRGITRKLLSHFYFFKAFDTLLETGGISYWALTKNALQLSDTVTTADPMAASLSGLFSSLIHEYPASRLKCIDMDGPTWDNEDGLAGEAILRELESRDGKVRVAIRNGRRYLPAFTKKTDIHFNQPVTEAGESHNVYLITGAGSGIGLEIYKRLSHDSNNRFILLRRGRQVPGSAPVKITDAAPADLFNSHNGTCAYEVDISDYQALKTVLEEAQSSTGKISHVIHAAGIAGKKRLRNHDRASFLEAITPKISGAINLFELLKDHTLQEFMLFSSHTAVIGEEKAANYGAANAFLDQYAHWLRKEGLPAKVISWPSWRETGMWHRVFRYSNTNLDDGLNLSTAEGLQLFDLISLAEDTQWMISKSHPSAMGPNPYFINTEEEVTLPGSAHGTTDLPLPPPSAPVTPLFNPLINSEWPPVQQQVAVIWIDILKPATLSPEDDFFDIGGHSLNGMQVIHRVEKEFGIKMEFEEMFDYPTLQEFSTHVRLLSDNGSNNTDRTIPVLAPQPYYELSYAQKQAWVSCQLPARKLSYLIPMGYRITGPVDRTLLRQAFRALIDRHEILRTTYHVVDGRPVQRINSSEATGVRLEEGEAPLTTSPDGLYEELIRQELNRDMDLENGPLFFVKIIELGKDDHLLIFNLHHIAGDAWSIEILLRDTLAAYQTLVGEGSVNPPPLRIQYKEFAAWHNATILEFDKNSHRSYWLEQITNARQTILPTDFPRPPSPDFKGDRVLANLDTRTSAALKDLARNHETTLFMTLQSLVFLLIHKYNNQQDLLVGTTVAGRDHADLTDQIGFYINTLPLRLTLDPSDSFRQLLKQVTTLILTAYTHQQYPDYRLQEEARAAGLIKKDRLFNILTNMLQASSTSYALPQIGGLSITEMPQRQITCKYDVIFNFTDTGGPILIGIEYDLALYEPGSIGLLAAQLDALVQQCCLDPDRPLREFSLEGITGIKMPTIADKTDFQW